MFIPKPINIELNNEHDSLRFRLLFIKILRISQNWKYYEITDFHGKIYDEGFVYFLSTPYQPSSQIA